MAFAGIGLYEGMRFLGFYRIRRDARLLYTGILSSLAGLYALVMVLVYAQPAPEAAHALTRWRYAVAAFFPFAFVGTAESLFGKPIGAMRRLSFLVGSVVFAAALLAPQFVFSPVVRIREVRLLQQTFYDFPAEPVGLALFAWAIVVTMYLAWLLVRSVSRRDFLSFSAFALGAIALFGVLDILTTLGVTNFPYFLEFGCVLTVMATNRALLQEYFDLLHEKEKLVNMRSRLLTNISHELRTPLGAAMGYLQILKRKPTVVEADRAIVARAYSALQDETELIEQLIDISRFAAEDPEAKREPVAIGPMLDDIFGRLKLLAERKSIELVASGDLDTIADVDPKWFPLAVKNLAHNAIKFSPVGSKIKVHVSVQGEELTIQVRDRGRGIPLREQQAIFGRFSQGGDAKDNDIEAGLGIGLALVRDVASAHGGDVNLSSRVWKGSVFEIRIPLRGPGQNQVAERL